MYNNDSTISFDQSAVVKLTEENKSTLITFAIKHIVETVASSYWYSINDSNHGWILNEGNFDGIWNENKDCRENLVKILINCYKYKDSYANKSTVFSDKFVSKKLKAIESLLVDKEDVASDGIRRNIVPILYPDFDYKTEIIRLGANEKSQIVVNNWIELASSYSNDQDLFEFLLSRIKREPGSTELKVRILNSAFRNHVICETAIKNIAASAPISLRRSVVSGLSAMMNSLRQQRLYSAKTDKDLKVIAEKLDKIEPLAMLFAALNDRAILRELGYSLSIKNLPWILPAASQHEWIVRDIQNRIDRGE